jgi:hypothetical protein
MYDIGDSYPDYWCEDQLKVWPVRDE